MERTLIFRKHFARAVRYDITFRNMKLVALHRWLSLILGLPIALAALSGLPLAFWEATDAATSPHYYAEDGPVRDTLTLDAAVIAVRQNYPGTPIHSVCPPSAPMAQI
jgi:uncharacterized iron-regulated membrane protein